ncbi:MAG: HAMP domain-containing histidine kinase [Muribaculaceae bacterium]|nr:HAMP domain-containing histidine kinase [Muribaculaceae bacterium]
MASKKPTSFYWRLFVPMTVFIWLIIIGMSVWFFHMQREAKLENIRSQVTLINTRIIAMYEKDNAPQAFLNFIRDYYREAPVFDSIRLSVYFNGERLTEYDLGEPIIPTDITPGDEIVSDYIETNDSDGRPNFVFQRMESADRRLQIFCILPFSNEVLEATKTSKNVLALIFVVALVATVLTNILARRMARNIERLRDFAHSAANDTNFIPGQQFSNDEFGDIARDIVKFHNTRMLNVRKLKREHEVALHALEEKTTLKRELTNNLSHELKTPVGVIKGYLDTIRDHPEMDPEALQHFLNKMSQHVDRLVAFLEDLSSINRLEFGTQMINTEPVDFHEIVFQSVSDLETSGIMGRMEINYDIPSTCRVIGNESLLSAMIANLAKNAAAYSKGTECNIVMTGEDHEKFTFEFYDNGVGVKEESIPHLFERFFREDTGRSRKKGGTGLGLCIVQNTVEALGGQIEAFNRPEGGLCFRFTLRKPKRRE